MRLVRLAVIGLSPPPRIKPTAATLRMGAVTLSVAPVDSVEPRTVNLVAKAFIEVPQIIIDQDQYAIIPAEPRQECEGAITTIADLYAVTGRCRRVVLTATPPLALAPDNDLDRVLLRQLRCIRAEASRPMSSIYSQIELKDAVAALGDRLNGAALIAEAYSHTTMSGRFREFVRLFELAFSRDFTQMEKKLAQTLHPALGYTQDEIRAWQALRHPFTHADGKLTKVLAFESDARGVIQRMEQAALDILFNKAEWSAWSSSRRNGWMPIAVTVDVSGKGVVRQNSTNVSADWIVLDEFRAFPRSLEMQHTNLPQDWFHQFVPAEQQGAVSDSSNERHQPMPAPLPMAQAPATDS
jgi:hypothetical protein